MRDGEHASGRLSSRRLTPRAPLLYVLDLQRWVMVGGLTYIP
jgi:hypothetical protein